VAPGLDSVRVYVGNTAEDVLNAMANDNISKILSTSWGWNRNFKTDDALFKQFAAQGQTNLTASGDYSSLACERPVARGRRQHRCGRRDRPRHEQGGWDLEVGNRLAAQCRRPLHRQADSRSNPTSCPTSTRRTEGPRLSGNVPDVAANANTNMMICADGSCGGGWGGTSFASPIWAGFIALANEQAVAGGQPVVGFINPAIYALGMTSNYDAGFHDIIKGQERKVPLHCVL
jgi:hypothetical protein